jgi:alkanesulfonate monooxygenase SsuD/methylene tetrahydromethanopterin reductase-like flavin-dependent oxidoreductase (luciferase family)
MRPKNVTVGIHVPAVSAAGLPAGSDYATFFRAIEALGLDSIWVEDRIFHRSHMLDSLSLLTWAAANTQRVRLGTAVLLLNIRKAAVVARQTSTLSHLSGGRLSLGVSLGGRPNEYEAVNVRIKRRVTALEDSIDALRRLLAGEPVTASHRSAKLDGAIVKPAASVPILLGGRAEPALRRAGRIGDGWIMGPFGGPGSLDEFERSWSIVRGEAAANGRDPDTLEAGRLIYVAVDEDRARAKARLESFLHDYYDPALDLEQITIYGPPDEVAGRLRAFVDKGMSHLMLGVPDLDFAHLERIAREVAPIIRA